MIAAATLDYMHARYYNPMIGRFLSVDPVGGSVGSSQSWNMYAYVLNSPMNFVDPTGELISFANGASEEAFWDYWDALDVDSQEYQNLMQLEDSEIDFVVNLTDTGGNAEGSVTFDGEKVSINVDPARPNEDASLQSRFAHEFQHGVQVDSGALGFMKRDNKWVAAFTDIYDEVDGYHAQLRQAQPGDFHRGILRGFQRAEDKAAYLINHGYGGYRGRGNQRVPAPRVPGYQPGQLFYTTGWFYRIPR